MLQNKSYPVTTVDILRLTAEKIRLSYPYRKEMLASDNFQSAVVYLGESTSFHHIVCRYKNNTNVTFTVQYKNEHFKYKCVRNVYY